MNTFDLIIFDCDGVLVDSERITCTVLRDMLNELGAQVSLQEVFDTFVGKATSQDTALITQLLGHPPPDDFVAHFRRQTRTALGELVTPVAGVPHMLPRLTTPYCVASSGAHDKMRLTLGTTGLLEHFEGRIFSVMDVPHPKPSPDVFQLAARTLDTDPEACAVIEDSPTGVRAGVAAGMRVFGFAAHTPRQRLEEAGAHHVFTDMQQLPDLLQAGR